MYAIFQNKSVFKKIFLRNPLLFKGLPTNPKRQGKMRTFLFIGEKTMVEMLGYIATCLVAISFLLKDVVKLRFVNAVGASCFVVYGFLIASIPVALLNTFIVCINGYYIWTSRKEQNV